MSTGKAPFHELGEPQAAMFKVGMFKIHPEIPKSLSAEAKAFILLCFEPDPNKRVTASDLFKDSFLKQVNKGKKNRIAFKPSDYSRSASLPLPVHKEQTGSSSSEPGSVSPDFDVQSDMLFEKAKRSLSELQSKSPISHLLSSIPDERNSSPSLDEKDSGLFLLRKDSERREILYKILKEQQNQVASNLQVCIPQSSEELRLSVAHIKQIIGILRDFIHTPEHRIMASTISKLKMDLDFDNASINQIQLVLFGFQDAVNKVLRNHVIKPHWMFAMDNIIRRAVQAAITILIPELQTHFEPASETEVDKEEDEIEEDYQQAEQGRPEESVTAGGYTLTSSQSPDTEQKLTKMLNAVIYCFLNTNYFFQFVQEDYTLSDVLNSITKEDLQLLRLRGGLVCRIWNAILKHRKQNTVLGMEV
uniref:Protein kinase domain-containing protein n=1 Tax=Laticauda laticaudata TaxID=8630 RepID=A0A8C5SJQ5_LATLA